MLSVATVLEHSARHHGDRVAIVSEHGRWTYAELDVAANRFAQGLVARGLVPGDRVALTCPNGAAFAVAHFGIIKAGLVSVPLNILLAEREIAYHLDDSGARAYVCHVDTPERELSAAGTTGFARSQACEHFVLLGVQGAPQIEGSHGRVGSDDNRSLAQLDGGFATVQTRETDTAVVLYTSGTTGRPKGAELTHSNLVHNALISTRSYELQPDDVLLVGVPLSHATGLTMLLHTGFAAGAALVMLPKYRPEHALTVMRDEAVTVFVGVPTMYQTLLTAAQASPELSRCGDEVAKTLRMGLVGGAPVAPKLLAEFQARFDVELLEGYGLSETSPSTAINRPGLERRAGSVGTAIWGVEIAIRRPDGTNADCGESGQVVVRGHNVMAGYLGNPEATRVAIDEHGWFHTGDIGRLDAEGYLTILGRHKDMIIRGGFNVYPRELEEVLLTHPEVHQSAVLGVPHQTHGEEVKAFVVRRPGATVTEDQLIDWCRTTMAGYKYPRLIEFRDDLPTNAMGKVLKAQLLAPEPATDR